MLKSNQLLAGRYRVIQVLGEGGLAKTYIAEDCLQPSRPKCAVKLLKPASNDSSFFSIAKRLFTKEAEILEKLGRHNQIPQLLAHFEEKKEFFIIQEFIEGHMLSTELSSGHCWSENKVILMLQDVLRTLEFVHSHGVIHRDIKPNNLIRREEDSKLVLIDFGAVKQVSDPLITTKAPLTPKTISIGTQGYMPMEQARGKPRLNSDIYALGMMGIQALTGIEAINLHEDADGEVIWQNHSKVSDSLGLVLSTMVRYHFRDRYQSVAEVLQALASLNNDSLDNQSISDNNRQSSVTLSGSTLMETKLSLENEHSNVKVISNNVLEESEVSLETNKSITKETSVEKLKETKISLDNKTLDTEASSEPNFKKAKKAQGIDPWSSWDKKDNPGNLVQPETSVNIKQINSETLSLENSRERQGFVEKDSWGRWESKSASQALENTTKKSLKNDYLDSEKTSQIELKESKLTQNIKQINHEIVSQLEIKETKTSLPNKYLALQANFKVNLQETKLSFNYEKLNTQTVSNLAIEKIKTSLAIIKQLNFKINVRDIENIINSVFLTLSQFYRVSPNNFIEKNKKSSLLIGSGLALVVVSLYAVYSNVKNRQFYSQVQRDLKQIEIFKTDKKYEKCIEQAQIFTRSFSDLSIKVDTLLNECYSGQIAKAENLANQSRFKDAIYLASQVPKNTKIYSKAQELISQWSLRIYQIANNKYQEGNLQAAIAIVEAIPIDIPLAKNMQITFQQWKREWKQEQTYMQIAQKALDERRWQDAINAAQQLSKNTYWQKQSSSIIQRAETEMAITQAASYKPQFIPGVTKLKDLYINPNHPINDPNRDWVKEKLGRE
jgi:serine/threonine protein kinase